jgi:hypothetical protein
LRWDVSQFWYNPRTEAPNGDINSGAFGLVTWANAPRIGQLALKFFF